LAILATGWTQAPDPNAALERGLRAFRQREFDTALEVWLDGLDAAENQGATKLAGSLHGNLGVVYGILGDRNKAIEHFEAALKIARESGDRAGLKNRLNNVAGLYLRMGSPEKALERLREGLPLAREAGDHNLECHILANMGKAHLALQQDREAEKALRAGLAVAAENNLTELKIHILSNLGVAYTAMGNYPQALSHFRMAITTELKQPKSKKMAALLIRDYNRLGVLARDMGDPQAAVTFHRSALEKARAAGVIEKIPASEQLLKLAQSEAGGGPEAMQRLQIAGLKRMLTRLRNHDLDTVAAQVEKELRDLESAAGGSVEQAAGPKLDLEKELTGAKTKIEVVARLEKLVETDPKNPTLLYELGKNYEEIAAEALASMRKDSADSTYYLAAAGEDHLSREEYDAALPLLKQAAEKEPVIRGVWEALAEAYDHTGRRDQVLPALEAERKLGQPDCGAKTAECEFLAGRPLEALVVAENGCAEDRYWRFRAAGMLSEQAFSRLVDLPRAPEHYALKAELERRAGRTRDALEYWKEALRLEPDNRRWKRELAASYCDNQDWVAARPIVEELLERTPDSSTLNYLEGEILWALERLEEAIPFLTKSLELDPGNRKADAMLARTYVRLGQLKQAIPHLERALPLDKDGSLHYQLARAYRVTGRREGVSELLAKHRELRQAAAAAQREAGH